MTKLITIAILGTRGIPARYGGFETFAEELATRLVQRGYGVTVYGRRRFFDGNGKAETVNGVRILRTPTVMHKYLETPLHALMSFLDLFRRRVSLVLLCNAANSPFAWLVRLRGLPLIINLDGIERQRSKWNWLGKLWYRLGELCSLAFATKLVADARLISRYYMREYGAATERIAYGGTYAEVPAGEVLCRFNLEQKKYLLYVSRLEPENNALGVIAAYNKLDTDMPLVIVGDAPYAKEYISQLKATASPRVIFTGYQFADAYRELRSHCYLYIQATEVGGTHPALVEALVYGNCVVANATPEHFEVLGGAGVYYWLNDFDHLVEQLRHLLLHPEKVDEYRRLAVERGRARYSWDRITDQYERLFEDVLGEEITGGLQDAV